MGGIFGLVSSIRPVAPVIRMGLERLIHRGIDGAGIATLYNNTIHIKKGVGKVTEVHDKVNLDDLPGYIGIGHVRSATHGRPAYENTHPVQDCTGDIALVMDGVISDYDELRRRLEKKHKLMSRTDAEAFAHMVEEELNEGKPMLNAIVSVVRQLRGYYTIAMLHRGDEKIYALSMGNPLVIGIGDKEIFLSSEESAIPVKLETVYYMQPGQMAIVSKGGVEFIDIESMSKISPMSQPPMQTYMEIAKGNFPHYMLKEIYEEPEALSRAINLLQKEYLNDAAMIVSKARNIIFTGSGTSYHASLVGKFYLEELDNIHADAIPAGEFPYEVVKRIEPGTLIIAVSQSGESADVIRAIRLAKRKGAVILGIVNRLGSALMRESNIYLPIGSGPEMAIPATKTFVVSIAVMLQLAYAVKGDIEGARRIINNAIASLINQLDQVREAAKKVAKALFKVSNMYVISGGPVGMPLAMETALKLKEAAQIHAEAINFREFKHGPITLTSREFPTIAVLTGEDLDEDISNVLSEVWSRGGLSVAIAPKGKRVTADHIINVEPVDRLIIPLVYPSAAQLLAYELGVLRDVDVDNPQNLSKVVTT